MNAKQQNTIDFIVGEVADWAKTLGQPCNFTTETVADKIMLSVFISAPRWFMTSYHYMFLIGVNGGFKRYTKNGTWVKTQKVLVSA